jgi:hypothetical protein
VGTPQNPLVNSPQNLQQLLDEVKSVTSGKSADVRDKTNKALVYAILDSAYIYAGGRNPSGEIDFQKFRQYLFDPLDGREGDSVAKLLEKNKIITQESFEDYQTLINQSAEIAQVMRNSGPQSVEKLQDKSALLANIVIRGLGAIGGNVVVNRLKGIFGNVPGASMSVAQTTSNATAELGLNMPAMKVQDIYIRAMTDKDLMQTLLTKIPKSEKKAIEYFRSLPAIFYTSGVRTETLCRNRLLRHNPLPHLNLLWQAPMVYGIGFFNKNPAIGRPIHPVAYYDLKRVQLGFLRLCPQPLWTPDTVFPAFLTWPVKTTFG